MTGSASQFADFDLDAFLAGQRTEMEDLAAALKREGLPPDWVMDDLLRHGGVRPVTLAREKAKLHVSQTVDRLLAHLRLPFLGDSRVFGARPPGKSAPGDIAITGDDGGALWLKNTFPLGTTSDVIKQWATEQADQLERTLRATNEKVAAHNEALRGIADRMAGPAAPRSEDADRLTRELSGQGV